MRKIRIGNDIRIQTVLNELSDFDQSAIKQLKCYVVHTSDLNYVDLNNFGYPQYYCPTEYDMNWSGIPRYNYLPYNGYVFNGGMFGPIDDYRIFPTYNGFGVKSRQFKITTKEYMMPSRLLAGKGAVEMYFPGHDQKHLGSYKVIIVVTVFEYGWGSNNLRTYTIDKGDLFCLVDDCSGESGNIILNTQMKYIKSIDVNSPLTVCAGDKINLLQSDALGTTYRILVNATNGETFDWTDSYRFYAPLYAGEKMAIDKSTGSFATELSDQNYETSMFVGDGDIRQEIKINVKAPVNVTIYKDGQIVDNDKVKFNDPYDKYIGSLFGNKDSIRILHGSKDITTQVTENWDNIITIDHVINPVIIDIRTT